ncbi:MAG: SAP domain-containing protein [Gammaproteobacteria bacterium]|nr:SAP domain-containing protein [Gammaproteobacteria bacterium]
MQMPEIRAIARGLGLTPPVTQGKTQLVRDIQRQEGNFDCFATAYDGQCDQVDCVWRVDCFALSKKAQKP